MIQKKRIAVLGSTGSIGRQALEVVRSHREAFEVTVLVARRSTELLIAQALEFSPAVVVISDEAIIPKSDKPYHIPLLRSWPGVKLSRRWSSDQM